MTVEINGKPCDIGPEPRKLTEVLKELGYATDFAAIAVNFECVPRGRWADTELRDKDSVEILAPHQGG